jgi:hypothetical protein
VRLINKIDNRLDDISYLSELFNTTDKKYLAKLKPKWCMRYSNFGILDEKTKTYYVLSYGKI